MTTQARKVAVGCLTVFFASTWLLLAVYFVNGVRAMWETATVSPYEYSRWVAAHDRSKTAILVRDYFFDLNFRLFIVDSGTKQIPTDVRQALWSSRDYEPTTFRNWREDVEWSWDSSVVAVTIEEAYVFAQDFATGQSLEDPNRIRALLEERGRRPTPAAR